MSTVLNPRHARLSPAEAREIIREGFDGTTAGWSVGWAQANVLAVPQEYAFDFMLFALRNPKPCPLLDVIENGKTSSTRFRGDITTDIGTYRVFENGQCVNEVSDVRSVWRPDLVTFLFGCSFTFERALVEAGIPVRHLDADIVNPMYRTSIPCTDAGRFRSSMVVTMRAIPAHLVADAVRITSRYPGVHGAPVHIGEPSAIGIDDLTRPDWGDSPIIESGDVCVFWACGVTPQEMVMQSRPSFAISHSPGRMAITDIPEHSLISP